MQRRLAATPFPGSPVWPAMTAEDRAAWWASRIWMVLGSPAAAPELLGPASDRFPVGAAIEAAARGLVVCATAREHGAVSPPEHVALLARVLLKRDIGLPDGSADTWALHPRPRGVTEAVAESVRIGRGLVSLLQDVAAELEGLSSPPRKKGWGRVPGVAVIRSATELRSTLQADARSTATLLEDTTAGRGNGCAEVHDSPEDVAPRSEGVSG